jgi:hypothetical protein
VGPDLAALAALPPADQDRASSVVQIALLKRERLTDSRAGAPEQHDERAEPVTVGTVTDAPRHAHDLLDRRRVSRVLLALVARRPTGW